MNTEIETRFCTRRNTNTISLVIVSGNGRKYKVPPTTVIVPAIVAVTTFILMLIY